MLGQEASTSVAAAFADLAQYLAGDLDIDGYLAALCRHGAALTGAGCAVIARAGDRAGGGLLVTASDERGLRLVTGAPDGPPGPWTDCVRTGQLVAVADLSVMAGRWPLFAQEAIRAGFLAVTVLPVRARAAVAGALALLGDAPPDAAGVLLAGSLAAVAGAGIAVAGELGRRDAEIAQLQSALTSRVGIEQAKGILAERWQVAPDDAFDQLRRHARLTRQRLPDLANAVVAGTADCAPPG